MANSLIYGFHQLADIAQQRAVEVDPDLLISAIQMSQQQHEAEMANLLGIFCDDVTVPQKKFKGGGISRSQPLDEFGVPEKIKGMIEYTIGFPLYMSGAAMGSNFVTNEKMSVQQLNDVMEKLYFGDFVWTRDQILAAMFASTAYTFADPDAGDITVYGMANGDATLYANVASDAGATDTHYLAQAAAIDDSNNPYPTIYQELVEHPGNGKRVVALISTSLVAGTKGLTNFFPVVDPNVELGANAAQLRGNLGVQLPGTAQIIGYCDECWIAHWSRLPAGYALGVAVDGEKPLARRQDVEPRLQGFVSRGRIEKFPYYEDIWLRRAGFGGYNRVGGLALRVGNAAWAVPTGYECPMR